MVLKNLVIILNANKPKENSIKLQTRKGSDIENSQFFEIAPHEKEQFKKLEALFPLVKIRNNPTAIYNCHGMTFASKRTGINESDSLKQILKDDNYIEIQEKDILPNDIILFLDKDDNIHHSGIIMYIDEKSHIPFICSKWGSYSEIVHSVYNSLYDTKFIKYYRVY